MILEIIYQFARVKNIKNQKKFNSRFYFHLNNQYKKYIKNLTKLLKILPNI